MGTANWRSWLLCTILAAMLPGCGMLSADKGPPADPLFARRPPEPAKAEFAPPVVVAFSEPTAPQDPLLAKSRPQYPLRETPGVLTNRPSND